MSADYNEARELIMIGGYVKGSMPEVDEAIRYQPLMQKYVQQGVSDKMSSSQSKIDLLSMFYSQHDIEVEMGEVAADEVATDSVSEYSGLEMPSDMGNEVLF